MSRYFIFFLFLFTPTTCTLMKTPNQPPHAIALSSYSTIEVGTPIILDGGKSYDPEGEPIKCIWLESPRNPEPDLLAEEIETTYSSEHCIITVTINLAGEYTFQLLVSDGVLDSEPATIKITSTVPQITYPVPPIAIAKADRTTVTVGETIWLSGEESYDLNGNQLTFAWSESYDNPVTGLVNPKSVTQFITFPSPGGYLFELKVFNGTQWSLPNLVKINVNTPLNQTPVALAGPDINVSYFEEVVISGKKSYDPDGNTDLIYEWRQTSGPPVNISAPSDFSEIHFTAPNQIMTLTFSLVVSDGQLKSAPDYVTVRVWEHTTNNQPDAVWVDRYYTLADSDGSQNRPFRSISEAISAASSYPLAVSDIYIARGRYYEFVTISNGISLYGGFNPQKGWERNLELFPTYIEGLAEGIAIEAPKSVTSTTYVDGLRILGPPVFSGNTFAIRCESSSLIIRNNFIYGGGGDLSSYAISLGSASPLIIGNVIHGGGSENTSVGIRAGYGETSAPPNSCPFILNNFIDGGGKDSAQTHRSMGIWLTLDAYPTIANNIISPGLGLEKIQADGSDGQINIYKRYGVYENNSNGGCSRTACPDGCCNPLLANNNFQKNHDWAVLYWDEEGEIKDEYQYPIKNLGNHELINLLGNNLQLDYSYNNLGEKTVFSGKDFGDYHLPFDPSNPSNPDRSSLLIDAGIDVKSLLKSRCDFFCRFDQKDNDFCDAAQDYPEILCGRRFPWIDSIIKGYFFDFDLDYRPYCLLNDEEEKCFDIGPDEVYFE